MADEGWWRRRRCLAVVVEGGGVAWCWDVGGGGGGVEIRRGGGGGRQEVVVGGVCDGREVVWEVETINGSNNIQFKTIKSIEFFFFFTLHGRRSPVSSFALTPRC